VVSESDQERFWEPMDIGGYIQNPAEHPFTRCEIINKLPQAGSSFEKKCLKMPVIEISFKCQKWGSVMPRQSNMFYNLSCAILLNQMRKESVLRRN